MHSQGVQSTSCGCYTFTVSIRSYRSFFQDSKANNGAANEQFRLSKICLKQLSAVLKQKSQAVKSLDHYTYSKHKHRCRYQGQNSFQNHVSSRHTIETEATP